MNTILLNPTDVLFFRDGRPMSGSLSGHGAAWPMPSVFNGALHAALWRADLADVHEHRRGRSSHRSEDSVRDRKFGSLVTSGPFPVAHDGRWLFPRPADAQKSTSSAVTLHPVSPSGPTSLPGPLRYAIANGQTPTKEKAEAWWSAAAWEAYLHAQVSPPETDPKSHYRQDSCFSSTEHSIGIGIDSEKGTQDGERLYSAHYLRLQDGWKMGGFAEALDKQQGDPAQKRDLIQALFPDCGAKTPIIIGGQQRVCTVERSSDDTLPLPSGPAIAGTRVKWVLLSPAIWPLIDAHPGGWLPSWINHLNGQVMLKADNTSRQDREPREAWRTRIAKLPPIQAKLVAAIVGKPLPISGYALPHAADSERSEGGAKPTHLAVPAGAVYYFEADSPLEAQKLAHALNWHGDGASNAIRNRRSTLLGEKGFGLGVCASWNFHPAHPTA